MDRHSLFSASTVATPDMIKAALDLVWEDSENNRELVSNIWRVMAAKYFSMQQSVDCACTKIQQDETCLVGYPSLLCEICDGKGGVPHVNLDGAELCEIVFGIANEVAHEISDEQYTKIAAAINSVFIDNVIPVSALSPREQTLKVGDLRELLKRLDAGLEYEGDLETENNHVELFNIEAAQELFSDAAVAIRALSSQPVADESIAARDVLAERSRQIEVEGWTLEHDDEHKGGEMAFAAASYIIGVSTLTGAISKGKLSSPWTYRIWPRSWDLKWWKPDDRRRNLVKAGALILAEIDRLDRLPASPGASE